MMGRQRVRKRTRARDDAAAEEEEEEPTLFPVGTEVEVRSDDQGFAGSFYEATVEGYLPSGRGYVVSYATLARREDGGSPHRERVAAADVRPRPPAARQRLEFAVHEMVEAFHHEGWWAGVVCHLPPPADDGERPRRVYTVCFPTTREVLELDEARLRPRLLFLGDRWVPAAEAENRCPIFREGSQVEVSRSLKTFGEYWSPATVLKVIDATSFLVEYGDVGEDGELVMDVMDAQYIRPGRNISRMDSKYRFRPSSFVEVFHERSWWPGVILKVLDNKVMKKYVVKIKNHETDMEDVESVDVLTVEHTRLRPRYDWYGSRWVRCLKEKQFNKGPQSTYAKRPVSSAIQSSNGIDNIAASPSCIGSDELEVEFGCSNKEKMNIADAELEAVSPDLSICNENDQIKQKPGSYPEQTVKQKNSVLPLTSPLALWSQLPVSGFGRLKYDPKLLSDEIQLSCPRINSMPYVPQTRQLQASLFGTFGQLRPLPQGPVLGIQSLNPDFASTGGPKKAFSVQEKQTTDKGYYLMADPQQKISVGSFVGTVLYRKRTREYICSQTPEEPGENTETVLTKKRIVHKDADKTSHDVASSVEHTKLKNDYDKDVPGDASYGSGILSETGTVASIDSTPLKDNKGSQERRGFLRESSAVDEIIPSGIPIGTDELHQGGNIGALLETGSGILSETGTVASIDSTPLKDNKGSQERRGFLRESSAVDEIIPSGIPIGTDELHQGGNIEALLETGSGILSETGTVASIDSTPLKDNKGSQERRGFLRESSAVDEIIPSGIPIGTDELHQGGNIGALRPTKVSILRELPSAESCEVIRNDYHLHKDKIADMVQLNMSCVVPTDNVSTMGVAMSSDVVLENCEANKKVDAGVEDCHGNRMELPRIMMTETQHVSTDGPFSAAYVPALKSDISIKQGLMKKSAADEHVVSHPDHRSPPMIEFAAECSQSTDKLALTQLSAGDGDNSTQLEHGNRLTEPKDADGTQMSLLQRSLDVHKSILADRPSATLAVENLTFVKSSPMWAQIEAMEIFSKMPQRPNFYQFQQHVPEVREGIALGLMLSFANLGESIKQLNIRGDNSLFEEKMKGISSLESHGFDVTHLRSHLETLLHIKNHHAELRDAIKKLEEMIAHEETADHQLSVQIGMLNSTVRRLEAHAYLLRCIMQSAVSQKIKRASEISRLKVEACELEHSYVSAEERFVSTVAAPW